MRISQQRLPMVLARYSSGALTSRQAVTGAAVALGAVSATAAAVYVYRYGLPSTSGSWASVRRYLTRYGVIAARPGAVPPAALGAPQTGLTVPPSRYPTVRRDDGVVDNLCGLTVPDPYRWLEDPDSAETQQFVALQNELTQEVLKQCESRGKFRDLMTRMYDYPKFGTPFKRGDRYYYYHNSGLQQHYVLYSQASLSAKPSVLLDPNTLSKDGTVALKDADWSDDGRLLAYSLSSGGSDWSTMHVLSIAPDSGKPTQLPDRLEFVKFSSIAWTTDNRGFFYNRYPTPGSAAASAGGLDLGTETDVNTHQQLCYHVLGTPQAEDVVVWAEPEHPTWMTGAGVTDDGRYLVLYVSEGCRPANRLYVVDLQELQKTTAQLPAAAAANGAAGRRSNSPSAANTPSKGGAALASSAVEVPDFRVYDFFSGSAKLPVVKLVDSFDASFSVVANEGSTFYLKTNLKAPRYRIVKADVSKAGRPDSWPNVLPHHEAAVLKRAVALAGDALVVQYMRDVQPVLQLRSLSTGGLLREFSLPGVGSVTGFSGDRKSSEFFFSFQSFTEPGATYRVDVSSLTGSAGSGGGLLSTTSVGGAAGPSFADVAAAAAAAVASTSSAPGTPGRPSAAPSASATPVKATAPATPSGKAGNNGNGSVSRDPLDPVLFRRTELKVDHNPEQYETKQVFVTSRDGTKVPMFITHRRGLALDGKAPCLLYGYGGFNISLEPGFSASRVTFMRGYGGVYAQANLRGGGEYGVAWRDAGSKGNKQNVFDDFHACAEYLVLQGYCSPASLTIQGGSNGGLLVAACINQRPDLYACGLAQVGVMDMLRFHKFTIGHAWMTDFGDPDDPADLSYIYRYSPLHNVRVPAGGSRQYPAMLLSTGDHDDRVVPLHSYKLIAELQHTLAAADPAASAQRNPLLIRVDVRSGHGAGKPTDKIIAETADLMAFAAKCMNAKWTA